VDKKEQNYYQSLYKVAAIVNSARVPESVLSSIVENVATAVGTKGCSLMLLTSDRKLLRHTAAYGLSDQYVQKGPLSADRSISEALQGRPVAVLEASKDERVQYPEEAKREGIASILSAPITLRDEIIGVIRLYTTEPRHFTPDDIYFVSAVANLGAIALENAKRYDSLQEEYETFRRLTF